MLDIILLGTVLLWLVIATVIDIKIKEVPNWLSFSLILIPLTIFTLKSLELGNIFPLKSSIISFIIFFIFGNIMYYTKQWGGGDSKLMMGLGASLPFYPEILKKIFNPEIGSYFPLTILLNLVLIGSIYGLSWSFILIIKNKKRFSKEFKKILRKNKKITNATLIFAIVGIFLSLFLIKNTILMVITQSILITLILLNYLFMVTKSVENISMYKKIDTKKLREGDWIVEKNYN